MDTIFVERLKKRAETMLPPDTAMLIECVADETDSAELVELLEHVFSCGLNGKPLCGAPAEAVTAGNSVLLRCEKCRRADRVSAAAAPAGLAGEVCREAAAALCHPCILGVGLSDGETAAKAQALRALARPMSDINPDRGLYRLESDIQRSTGALAVKVCSDGGTDCCAVCVSCALLRRADAK